MRQCELFACHKTADEIIEEAISRYKPSHVFGLFSGGHDSLCACHVASRHPQFTACVHINTGIGIEQTREFVRDTCRQFGWQLLEYHPPVTYEQLVIEHGFPGPGQHFMMYRRLKERALRFCLREHKTGRIMLISGARRQESTRRMGSSLEVNLEGRQVWVNPLIDWDTKTKNDYIRQHDLPQNPVVQRLCMSGECLCGAFAEPGELDLTIRPFYPEAAAEIDRIADKVKAAGKHCIWGTRPPDTRNKPDPNQMDLPLCFSCGAKWERSCKTI